MKLTKQELKLLLTLNGNTRLAQYEVEIFADAKLTDFYLSSLSSTDGVLYTCVNKNNRMYIIYQCARYIIGGRWLEAESVIATDAEYAYYYAAYVIKSRFPEAESVIAKDKYYWEVYSEKFKIN
jgi:hypothetical protein